MCWWGFFFSSFLDRSIVMRNLSSSSSEDFPLLENVSIRTCHIITRITFLEIHHSCEVTITSKMNQWNKEKVVQQERFAYIVQLARNSS